MKSALSFSSKHSIRTRLVSSHSQHNKKHMKTRDKNTYQVNLSTLMKDPFLARAQPKRICNNSFKTNLKLITIFKTETMVLYRSSTRQLSTLTMRCNSLMRKLRKRPRSAATTAERALVLTVLHYR